MFLFGGCKLCPVFALTSRLQNLSMEQIIEELFVQIEMLFNALLSEASNCLSEFTKKRFFFQSI
jgi:hypothetical protein